jgi:hypothetical protein
MTFPLRAGLLCLLAAGGGALAQPAYLDDRSTPEQLVASLYNAINRGEFARAWSYFAAPPAKSFDAYAKGYEGTGPIELRAGSASEEGTAGATVYRLPVAIRSHNGNAESVYAGCYTLRLPNPQAQEPPVRPMTIEKGALRKVEADLAAAVPASCAGEDPADEDGSGRASAFFARAYAGRCQSLSAGAVPGAAAPDVYDVPFRYESSQPDEPEQHYTLYRFNCDNGAYNFGYVFVMSGMEGELSVVSFPQPRLDIAYEDEEQTKVKSMRVAGYVATDQLVNAEYDEDSKTLTAASKWRGIGDAQSVSEWTFAEGEFVLVRHSVDATYDGEIGLQTVLDFEKEPGP